jgi:hypothetical protein
MQESRYLDDLTSTAQRHDAICFFLYHGSLVCSQVLCVLPRFVALAIQETNLTDVCFRLKLIRSLISQVSTLVEPFLGAYRSEMDQIVTGWPEQAWPVRDETSFVQVLVTGQDIPPVPAGTRTELITLLWIVDH